jgi:hypothetical protein
MSDRGRSCIGEMTYDPIFDSIKLRDKNIESFRDTKIFELAYKMMIQAGFNIIRDHTFMEIHSYKDGTNTLYEHYDDINGTYVETIIFYIKNTFENECGNLILNNQMINTHTTSGKIKYVMFSGDLLHNIVEMNGVGERLSVVIQFKYNMTVQNIDKLLSDARKNAKKFKSLHERKFRTQTLVS